MLYAFSMDRWTLPIDLYYGLFLVFSTISLYSLHRIIGLKKVDNFGQESRFYLIKTMQKEILWIGILSFLGSLYCISGFSFHRILLMAFPVFVSLGYTFPLTRNHRRLRDIGLIKIFLIALAWTFLTGSIPLIEHHIPLSGLLILGIERIFFFIAITLPFDVRDMEIDKRQKVLTLPHLLGRPGSFYLSEVLVIAAYIIDLIATCYFDLNGHLSLGLTYLTGAVLLWHVHRSNEVNELYYAGWIDGLIMLPFLIECLFYQI